MSFGLTEEQNPRREQVRRFMRDACEMTRVFAERILGQPKD